MGVTTATGVCGLMVTWKRFLTSTAAVQQITFCLEVNCWFICFVLRTCDAILGLSVAGLSVALWDVLVGKMTSYQATTCVDF